MQVYSYRPFGDIERKISACTGLTPTGTRDAPANGKIVTFANALTDSQLEALNDFMQSRGFELLSTATIPNDSIATEPQVIEEEYVNSKLVRRTIFAQFLGGVQSKKLEETTYSYSNAAITSEVIVRYNLSTGLPEGMHVTDYTTEKLAGGRVIVRKRVRVT